MSVPSLDYMIPRLIACPSVSCAVPSLDMGNRGVLDELAPWLKEAGFRVEIQDVDAAKGKANLLATKGRGDGGLVLSGHTDTVPFDEGLWQSAPFQADERDDKIYGLGSADMKSFLAMAIEASKDVRAEQLSQPLMILATCDEETSMSGARALVRAGWPKARHAVIGEPTSLRPVRLHKGITMLALKVTGQSGHSSNPALGNNALDGMVKVMGELLLLRQQLAAEHSHPGFEVREPTLNLGCIHGGDSPNRICGQCELHIDVRVVPGLSLYAVRERVTQAAQRVLADSGLQLQVEILFDGIDALETPANAEIVQLCEKLTGHDSISVAFATEAPLLTEIGISTVVMGPGSIDQAHQPNEFLPRAEIAPTVSILRGLIERCCVAG